MSSHYQKLELFRSMAVKNVEYSLKNTHLFQEKKKKVGGGKEPQNQNKTEKQYWYIGKNSTSRLAAMRYWTKEKRASNVRCEC